MQDSTGPQPKQLLSERIKNATSILVTVSRDPSVDELSAALALTLILNKLDKHATAVFSGKIPPAIEFLNPEKTFEGTVDSLRDFIIALDKEKADRLRYKVEDDVVRIFITPYRTTISEKDLAFSQGDFNVELIVALGVDKKEDLDKAIAAHGRILHDAVVATINTNNQESTLGTIDWTDASASSFSEMLMSLSESLKSGILDEQIATALLTGIVAATGRFSNNKTTPKVMTMSAQLMAAGANQQLIATKLEEGNVLPGSSGAQADTSSQKLATTAPAESKKSIGEMRVDHAESSDADQAVEKATELADEAVGDNEQRAQETLSQKLPAAVAPTLSVEDLQKDLAAASEEVEKAAQNPPRPDWQRDSQDQSQPVFGGTLNATADEAHDAKEREDRLARNHTLLSHDGPSAPQAPLNAGSPGYASDEPPSVDPFAEPPKSDPASPLHYEPIQTHAPTIQPLPSEPPQASDSTAPTDDSTPTVAELETQAHSAAAANPVNDARAAVNAALEVLPLDSTTESVPAIAAQPLPGSPLHDTPAPDAMPLPTSTQPAEPISLTPPPPPPLPDFSTLPPLPPEPEAPLAPVADTFASPVFDVAPSVPAPAPTPVPSNDPGQFKLPGQN